MSPSGPYADTPAHEEDAVILLYHGVTDAVSHGIENFSGKHIRAEVFEAQIAWLAENANPTSLRDMAAKLSGREDLPARSVAVTFDDTYKNNRTVALPILERHGVPATFFVSTGFVGTARRFWTDKVEHCLNACRDDAIQFDLPGRSTQVWPLRDKAEKIAAVVEIKSAMKAMRPAARDATLAELQDRTGVGDPGEDVPNYRNLDWADVKALDSGLCEVGGHSVNHEILSYLSAEQLVAEVDGCVGSLEQALGHSVDLFSYPEGQAEHYSPAVIDRLKQAGVAICPSAIHGANRAGADPFHLRRVMVGFMGTPFPYITDEMQARV